MLILYTTPACLYCEKVKSYFETAGIPYEIRDIATHAQYRDELLVKGGKLQVPFLVDTDHTIALYESADIIAYVEKQYGSGRGMV